MAELATIARPYAEAVFELARQTDSLTRWSDTLARLAAAAVHPDIVPLIDNPRVSNGQRVDVFMTLAGETAAASRNFVETLAENGRLAVLPYVRDEFEDLKNHSEGIVEADIATAFPLSESDLAGLVIGLERRFKNKVHANVQSDETLIGGVRIRVGDAVIDNSVRGKLTAMRSALVA